MFTSINARYWIIIASNKIGSLFCLAKTIRNLDTVWTSCLSFQVQPTTSSFTHQITLPFLVFSVIISFRLPLRSFLNVSVIYVLCFERNLVKSTELQKLSVNSWQPLLQKGFVSFSKMAAVCPRLCLSLKSWSPYASSVRTNPSCVYNSLNLIPHLWH